MVFVLQSARSQSIALIWDKITIGELVIFHSPMWEENTTYKWLLRHFFKVPSTAFYIYFCFILTIIPSILTLISRGGKPNKLTGYSIVTCLLWVNEAEAKEKYKYTWRHNAKSLELTIYRTIGLSWLSPKNRYYKSTSRLSKFLILP